MHSQFWREGVRGDAVIDLRAGSGELRVHWVEVAF